MIRRLVLLLSFSLLAAPAYAASQETAPTASLFFTPDESRQIEAARARTAPRAAHDWLQIDAILYTSPDAWTVWAQGERWTPATSSPRLQLLAVTPTSVTLNLHPAPDAPPRTLTLKPHQAYQISTGRILERGSEE